MKTFLTALLVAACTASCGPSSGGSAAGGGSGGGTAGGVGGGSADGGSDGGMDGGPSAPSQLGILVFAQSTPQPGFASDFAMNFGLSGDAGISSCTQQAGQCCFLPAHTRVVLDEDLSFYPQNLGDLTITRGQGATSAVLDVLKFRQISGYSRINGGSTPYPPPVWDAGEYLSFASNGNADAGIGPIDGGIQSVALIQGIVPPITFSNGVPVPRANDFNVQWTPDPSALAGETMFLRLIDSNTSAAVLCIAPDSQATVTVPSALLGNFVANSMGTFVLNRLASTPANAPTTHPIRITTSTHVLGYLRFQ